MEGTGEMILAWSGQEKLPGVASGPADNDESALAAAMSLWFFSSNSIWAELGC